MNADIDLGRSNTLLARLSAEDASLISPAFERVTLAQGEVLFEPMERIDYVYFFEGGLSSEIVISKDNRIEVGCIGLEGFSAVPVVLGVDRTPHHGFMQAGGPALRVRAPDLQTVMSENKALQKLLLLYAHVFMIQIAATALADGRYDVESRLARWLLMSQDRLGDELPLTHEFLGLMLGVRRPSVTDALHVLEGKRAIKSERSLITVRNRQLLEEIAAGSYGIPEAEYRRLIIQA